MPKTNLRWINLPDAQVSPRLCKDINSTAHELYSNRDSFVKSVEILQRLCIRLCRGQRKLLKMPKYH